MKRRNFIRNSISFATLLACHYEVGTLPRTPAAHNKKSTNRFKSISLRTSQLAEQKEFYTKVLGLPLISSERAQFTLRVGQSTLQFVKTDDGSAPFYHYAINIPSNKHEKAKDWLSRRTPLLTDSYSGQDLLYFDFWDAHAMYFKDPAGNIGELIARHTLDNDKEGEFGVSDLLYLSEIGTPVEDPNDFALEIESTFGLQAFGSNMFIGDELGLLVAVPIDRLWIPENIQKAVVHPTDIVLSGNPKKEFQYKNYPYHIIQE